MKKESLTVGKRVKIANLITDYNGALYKGDIVTIFDWTNVADVLDAYIIYIEDIHGRHHSVSLDDIEEMIKT
jgi:hypothetical protein